MASNRLEKACRSYYRTLRTIVYPRWWLFFSHLRPFFAFLTVFITESVAFHHLNYRIGNRVTLPTRQNHQFGQFRTLKNSKSRCQDSTTRADGPEDGQGLATRAGDPMPGIRSRWPIEPEPMPTTRAKGPSNRAARETRLIGDLRRFKKIPTPWDHLKPKTPRIAK